MKKLICQVGMCFCALGMLMVLGGMFEETLGLLAGTALLALLLAVQVGLGQLARKRVHRRAVRLHAVPLSAAAKSRLTAA